MLANHRGDTDADQNAASNGGGECVPGFGGRTIPAESSLGSVSVTAPNSAPGNATVTLMRITISIPVHLLSVYPAEAMTVAALVLACRIAISI